VSQLFLVEFNALNNSRPFSTIFLICMLVLMLVQIIAIIIACILASVFVSTVSQVVPLPRPERKSIHTR